MTSPHHERRYLKPTVAHLLPATDAGLTRHTAVCGRTPVWYSPTGWLGTGNQGERDTVAALPLCKRCAADAPQPADPP